MRHAHIDAGVYSQHQLSLLSNISITSQYKAREHDDDRARAKSAIEVFLSKPRRKLSGPRFSNALETCLKTYDAKKNSFY